MSQLLAQQAAAQVWATEAFASQVSVFVSAETRIARALLAVPQVESVYINRTKDITRVWTIIDAAEEQVFDAIYQREQTVISDLAPDRFDFHVVARQGRPLRTILT